MFVFDYALSMALPAGQWFAVASASQNFKVSAGE
jgi:hypothetical protein